MNLDRNTLAGILAPAAVGALGGGAIAGHLSNRVKRPHESPQEHRRRVLRNALMGAALGGGAGAAIPGAMLAGSTFSNAKPGVLSRTADAGIGGLAHNFAGIGVGTVGGLAVHRNNATARVRARKILADTLFGNESEGSRLSKLEAALSNPEEIGAAIKRHTHAASPKPHGLHLPSGETVKGRELSLSGLLEAAGHKHEFAPLTTGGPVAKEIEGRLRRTALQTHLQGQGAISKWLAGKIHTAGGVGHEGLLESGRLAEQFRKITGPGAFKSVRRIAPAVGAAAIIPAAMMANRAQHQLMGE